MSLCLCAAGCGADVSKVDGAFCGPCRESLGLPALEQPVKARIWTEKEVQAFRDRERRATELQARIAVLPDPEIDDPFVGVNGQDLGTAMHHTGAGGVR